MVPRAGSQLDRHTIHQKYPPISPISLEQQTRNRRLEEPTARRIQVSEAKLCLRTAIVQTSVLGQVRTHDRSDKWKFVSQQFRSVHSVQEDKTPSACGLKNFIRLSYTLFHYVGLMSTIKSSFWFYNCSFTTILWAENRRVSHCRFHPADYEQPRANFERTAQPRSVNSNAIYWLRTAVVQRVFFRQARRFCKVHQSD